MEGRYFNISGYWKNDGEPFSDNIVTNLNDGEEGVDDEVIFMYGIGEDAIISAIEAGEDSVFEFVITSYETLGEDE